MELNSKTAKYYEWDDIQQKLCDIIGIDVKHFRKYHKVVGGDYKDLWHVWLDLDGGVRNDSYSVVYWWGVNSETWDDCYASERIKESYGEWALVLLKAFDILMEELGEETITIWYSW